LSSGYGWRPHVAQKRLGDNGKNQPEGNYGEPDTAAQMKTLLVGHEVPSQASLMALNAESRS
jgi:hypothetical protein